MIETYLWKYLVLPLGWFLVGVAVAEGLVGGWHIPIGLAAAVGGWLLSWPVAKGVAKK